MTSIAEYPGRAHQRGDGLFARSETHISKNRWKQAKITFSAFAREFETHCAMQGKVLLAGVISAMSNAAQAS